MLPTLTLDIINPGKTEHILVYELPIDIINHKL